MTSAERKRTTRTYEREADKKRRNKRRKNGKYTQKKPETKQQRKIHKKILRLETSTKRKGLEVARMSGRPHLRPALAVQSKGISPKQRKTQR